MFFMLNISSKQEMSEPHHLTAPALRQLEIGALEPHDMMRLLNADCCNADYCNADKRNADYLYRNDNNHNADYHNADYRNADYRNADYRNADYCNADCRNAGLSGIQSVRYRTEID
jgi:hypothetical protein